MDLTSNLLKSFYETIIIDCYLTK